MKTAHQFTGMWVTADGHIRHELLPNRRYDEARGKKKLLIREVIKLQENTSIIKTIPASWQMVISRMMYFIMRG